MRRVREDRQVFDFETNAWVALDRFSARTAGRETVLDAPATPPEEGFWTKPPAAKRPASLLMILAAWTSIGLMVASIVLRSVGFAGSSLLVLAGIASIVLSRQDTERRMTIEDRRLLEDPDDRDVCLVHIEIVRDGKNVGEDKGVAWFAEGMLLYSGHRTSFALGGEDVLPQSLWDDATALVESRLPLRVAEGRAHVTISPLVEGNGTSPHEMRFLKNLYAFRRRPPTSKGPRQWPPFDAK